MLGGGQLFEVRRSGSGPGMAPARGEIGLDLQVGGGGVRGGGGERGAVGGPAQPRGGGPPHPTCPAIHALYIYTYHR